MYLVFLSSYLVFFCVRALAGGASSPGLVPKRSRSGASSSKSAAVASWSLFHF